MLRLQPTAAATTLCVEQTRPPRTLSGVPTLTSYCHRTFLSLARCTPQTNLSWWQKHHPSWVVYQCDRTTPSYEFGDVNVLLDIIKSRRGRLSGAPKESLANHKPLPPHAFPDNSDPSPAPKNFPRGRAARAGGAWRGSENMSIGWSKAVHPRLGRDSATGLEVDVVAVVGMLVVGTSSPQHVFEQMNGLGHQCAACRVESA